LEYYRKMRGKKKKKKTKTPYYTEFRMCNDYEKPQDIYQHHNRGKVATDIFNAMKGCCKPEMLYCYLKGQLKYRVAKYKFRS